MKKLKFNKITWIFSILFLCFLMFSCNEDPSTEDNVDQLFRPVSFTAYVDRNNVSFSWVPIAGASYSLEISRDNLLFQNDLQVFSIDEASSYYVGDLWNNARYSARIKAVSKDVSVKDSEYKEITFETGSN